MLMANLDSIFKTFDQELNILSTKKDSMMTSRDHLRIKIKDYFDKNHPDYKPSFYIQGSYKLKTLIRAKDDTCDLDDGVYFKSNPEQVTGTTLQSWIKDAVDGTTDASPVHKKKCIRVNYKAGYNIDLPVMIYDASKDAHPSLAVKNSDFKEDDPKEFVDEFKKTKSDQKVRMIKYLKSWCDHKQQDMPSGLSMTVLTMNHFNSNTRDDVALKYLLIEIEKSLKTKFTCVMPTTPKDDLFSEYTETKKTNFLNNLSDFIDDAKKAIDEKNQLKSSRLWAKHLGNRFPEGKDEDEEDVNRSSLQTVASSSRPYFLNNEHCLPE